MDPSELHWLSGLLEGEGSFIKGPPSRPNAPQVSLQMTDEDIVARAAALCGVKYYTNPSRKAVWKVSFTFHVRGRAAVELMRQLYPLMGTRRRLQIDAAIANYDPARFDQLSRVWPNNEHLLRMRERMSLREMGKMLGTTGTTVMRRLRGIAV